jgi:hypothetical protein
MPSSQQRRQRQYQRQRPRRKRTTPSLLPWWLVTTTTTAGLVLQSGLMATVQSEQLGSTTIMRDGDHSVPHSQSQQRPLSERINFDSTDDKNFSATDTQQQQKKENTTRTTRRERRTTSSLLSDGGGLSPRIINGVEADPSQFPFVVVLTSEHILKCAGSVRPYW